MFDQEEGKDVYILLMRDDYTFCFFKLSII